MPGTAHLGSSVRISNNGLSQLGLSRRELLRDTGLILAALAFPLRLARGKEAFELPDASRQVLAKSPYVYVSPLHPDGKESRCHGEVWYFMDGGDVVIATGADRWKTRAVKKGWDQARIWAGDYGRVKSDGDRFRGGPTFLTRAELDTAAPVFERLMGAFGTKYPDEWGKWEPRFRKAYGDGSRILIRYRPIGA